MKQNRIINSLLVCLAVFFAACSEEVYSPSFSESKNVTLSLSYADLSPREITVNTRATTDAERKLDNLYIYIFDGEGKLKGFKAITSNLIQNTSDVNNVTGEVSGIKTKSGESYIFAVANIETGLYPVSTSNGTVEEGKLPIGLDETKAQAGDYASFTKDNLMSLLFTRNNKNTIQISGSFLMSGSLNGGKVVNISESTNNPTITDEEGNNVNIIKLRRVVSKVNFTVSAAAVSGDVTERSFTLSSYDIINISVNGNLVADNNTTYKNTESSNFSDIKDNHVGVNGVNNGVYNFECYLPENLQDAQNASAITTWNDREADDQGVNAATKTFTNAPQYGTYIVLKGKYLEKKSGTTRSADVTYYVHFGDCSADVTDYNVERNCEYTYKVTVAGVDKIVVEAQKNTQDQPGAEGVVLEYGSAGKSMTLDAHYEYMVMRFYQNDIKKLKEESHGYFYQVKTINGSTDVIEVKDGEIEASKLNGVDTDWVEFAINNGSSKSTYGTANNGRGTACKYPGHETNGNLKSGLYSIEDFLKNLYNNASTDSYWTGSDSNGKYIDATCFVSENYYKDRKWSDYTNKDNRSFYVANSVETSKDTRSVYAKVQYGLDQYAIQTFYDRSQTGVIAYGIETRDETGATGAVQTTGSEDWNGRVNFLKDLNNYGSYGNWTVIDGTLNSKQQCLKRNRDLNGDGTITENELRWYAPTIQQYSGLWIGEEALSTESRLYGSSTKDLTEDTRQIYWASTSGKQNFFSEEGMATGSVTSGTWSAKNIRCARNLKSNDTNDDGYEQTPQKYYTYQNHVLELAYVDESALNITGETGELSNHDERDATGTNKAAKKFTIATYNYPGSWKWKGGGWGNNGSYQYELSDKTTMYNVVEGRQNCSKYKNTSSDSKQWRVPNQREYCLMGFSDVLGQDILNARENNYTFCRTKFSNTSFRYSWTYQQENLMMQETENNAKNLYGYIRCIHVEKY